MKRLFVAIKINPDQAFLDQVRGMKSRLGHEKIRWVEEHNIHITLIFLGETEEKWIPEIIRVLENVAEGVRPLSVSLRKTGIFGSSYDPRVVWTGIEPFAEIAGIMKMIRDNMESIGWESDRQNLVPHLTLGRIKFLKDKKLFQQVMEEYREIESQEMVVDHFVLFESILKKEGPVYLALHSFPLRKLY